MFFKKIVVSIISLYQYALSPDSGLLRYCGFSKGGVCMFSPSCSEYTKEKVASHGVCIGLFLGLKRIFRCHPYSKIT